MYAEWQVICAHHKVRKFWESWGFYKPPSHAYPPMFGIKIWRDNSAPPIFCNYGAGRWSKLERCSSLKSTHEFPILVNRKRFCYYRMAVISMSNYCPHHVTVNLSIETAELASKVAPTEMSTQKEHCRPNNAKRQMTCVNGGNLWVGWTHCWPP